MKTLAFAVLPGLLCGVPGGLLPAGAQSFSVLDLGMPGTAGSYSDPHGLNSSGVVAGEWEATNSVYQRAFCYLGGTNLDLGTLQGAYAVAYGINDSNRVVGASGATRILAFVYTNGVMTGLGTLGGTYSVAWAINNPGQIVGESTVASSPGAEDHAIWWHEGTNTDLGVLPGGDYSSARGINDSGVIVGESSVIAGGVTNIYAFIRTNGVLASLGALPGGNYSSARAINAAGQVAGEAALGTGDTHAFLWSSGVMSDLGGFGGNYSTASALNSAGQVVGYALTAGGEARACWFNGSTLFDLNDLIGPSTVCTNLISADGINDAGQITGSGYTPAGDYHAFLLTPLLVLTAPVPGTNGGFSMTVQGLPGQQFVLESSADLAQWTALSTNKLATSSLECTDAGASASGRAFYRARLQP